MNYRFIIALYTLFLVAPSACMQPLSEKRRLAAIKNNPQQMLDLAYSLCTSQPEQGITLLYQIAEHSSMPLENRIKIIYKIIEQRIAIERPPMDDAMESLWKKLYKAAQTDEERYILTINYAHYLFHYSPQTDEDEKKIYEVYADLAHYQGEDRLCTIAHNMKKEYPEQAEYIAQVMIKESPYPLIKGTMKAILASLAEKETTQILWQEALNAADRSTEQKRYTIYYLYADYLRKNNRAQEAETYFKRIASENNPHQEEILVFLGNEALKKQRYQDALNYFKDVIAKPPSSPTIAAHKGMAFAHSAEGTLASIQKIANEFKVARDIALTMPTEQKEKELKGLQEQTQEMFGISLEDLMSGNQKLLEQAALHCAKQLMRSGNKEIRPVGIALIKELITTTENNALKDQALYAQASYLSTSSDETAKKEACTIFQRLANGRSTKNALRIQAQQAAGNLLAEAGEYEKALPLLNKVLESNDQSLLKFCAFISILDYYTAKPEVPIDNRHHNLLPVLAQMYRNAGKIAVFSPENHSQFAPHLVTASIAFLYGKTLLSFANLLQKRGGDPLEIKGSYDRASKITECPGLQKLAVAEMRAYEKKLTLAATMAAAPRDATQRTNKNQKRKQKNKAHPALASAEKPLITALVSEPEAHSAPEQAQPIPVPPMEVSSDTPAEFDWEKEFIHQRVLSAVKRGNLATIQQLMQENHVDPSYEIGGKPITLHATNEACLNALLQHHAPQSIPLQAAAKALTAQMKLTAEAQKQLECAENKDSVTRALDDLVRYGRGNIKALKDADGMFRLRVGKTRVLFSRESEQLTIQKIAPRDAAYKK